MALLDVFTPGTGLVSSTLVQTDFDAVSVGASATLAASAIIVRGLNSYSVSALTGASSVVCYGDRDWGSDEATIYACLYVRFTVVPTAITSYFSILDSTPAAIVDLRVSAAGLWSIYNYGNTTTYTSTGPAVVAAVWYRVELKLVVHDSTGTIDVKINGVLEPGISALSGLDTKAGNNARRYRIGVTVAQANAGVRYFDDVGISNSDWLGKFYVKTMLAYTNDAANWTVVDAGSSSSQTQRDRPWASATTDLIESVTASQEERYKYPTVAQTGGTWLGVIPVIRERRAVAGSAASVVLNIRVAAADGTASAAIDSGGTTYLTKRGALQVTDPNTGIAWTLVGLNAMILRIVKDAGVNKAQINASLVYVAFASNLGVASSNSKGTKGASAKYFDYTGYYSNRHKALRGL